MKKIYSSLKNSKQFFFAFECHFFPVNYLYFMLVSPSVKNKNLPIRTLHSANYNTIARNMNDADYDDVMSFNDN